MERDELRKGFTIYEDKDGNTVQISEDVIASIAAMSIKDIKGVYAVGTGMKNGIMERLGWEDLAKGVTVEVLEDDTPEVLQKRVMEQAEWIIMPQAIDDIANGRITIDSDNHVIISK